MRPHAIEDEGYVVEPTTQGGVEIRTTRRYWHLPPGPPAEEFWHLADCLGSVGAACGMVEQTPDP